MVPPPPWVPPPAWRTQTQRNRLHTTRLSRSAVTHFWLEGSTRDPSAVRSPLIHGVAVGHRQRGHGADGLRLLRVSSLGLQQRESQQRGAAVQRAPVLTWRGGQSAALDRHADVTQATISLCGTHCESLKLSPESGQHWGWASAPGRPSAAGPAVARKMNKHKHSTLCQVRFFPFDAGHSLGF